MLLSSRRSGTTRGFPPPVRCVTAPVRYSCIASTARSSRSKATLRARSARGACAARASAASCRTTIPNRLTVPLRRTNPKKGLDEDPGWKEISWEEALDEIATVLKRVRAEDPRKLLIQRTTTVPRPARRCMAFGTAFGTPNYVDIGRRAALRQRRASDQRDHACVLVDRAGFRVLQLRHLLRRLQGPRRRPRVGFEHEARRRCPGARHEDGGGRSDVQLRLGQGDRMGAACGWAPTRRWRFRCATCW